MYCHRYPLSSCLAVGRRETDIYPSTPRKLYSIFIIWHHFKQAYIFAQNMRRKDQELVSQLPSRWRAWVCIGMHLRVGGPKWVDTYSSIHLSVLPSLHPAILMQKMLQNLWNLDENRCELPQLHAPPCKDSDDVIPQPAKLVGLWLIFGWYLVFWLWGWQCCFNVRIST